MKTPYYTSNDIIAAIQRKISMPVSQSTFSKTDILSFCNEEMFIAQVPKVLSFHSEYFVTYKVVPLVQNVSRYPIPDRAIGMKLRDLFWMDTAGTIFEMSQVEEHDRSFFQRSSTTTTQTIHKFFIEGNDIVLSPGVSTGPTGFLIQVFYLRPNQLVKNDRAAIISNFQQTITLHNSLINVLDYIDLAVSSSATTPAGDTYFTAVNSLGGTITALSTSGAQTLVTSVGHQLQNGQTVVLAGTNSNPSVNGTFIATVVDANTFTIPVQIKTAGTTGTFTSPNQFLIGASDALTAANLASSISSLGITAAAVNGVVTVNFTNIYTQFLTNNPIALVVPSTTIGINFTSLPNTYTDDETNVTENLFVAGTQIDFMQTKSGHKTYTYDVTIPAAGITGTVLNLPVTSLLVPTGTVNLSNSSVSLTPSVPSVQYMLAPLVPGDYICLSNECIIPQIPPDLHNGLAEMAAARILAALGDQPGLAASLQKIQDIETKEGNLMANRSDGNPLKVTGRHSPLRMGKIGLYRRW